MTEIKEKRQILRKEKIIARDSLTTAERDEKSEQICELLVASEEFRNARTILIYKAIRGEVRLYAMEAAVSKLTEFKKLAYPLVVSNTDMVALIPQGDDSWTEGYYGIREPIKEKSAEIMPQDIDLIVCPCTSFDEEGGRMGMGAGFYDRYIERARQDCESAGIMGKPKIVAVAFECQKSETVIRQTWDQPMDAVFTEKKVYRF